MSVEMEIPKILWLKNNMPKELFDRCKFYDLTDALTYLATGSETRSFCSTVCKQGYVPVGVDGSKKGWKDEFFEAIGLQDLMKNDYIRLGGVNGVVSPTDHEFIGALADLYNRMANTSAPASSSVLSAQKPHLTGDSQPAYLSAAVSSMRTPDG
jgi:ribulose kinase